MSDVEQPEIIVLGSELPYADGAEADLLAIMRGVEDRSAGSPELQAQITDWPTRYHLSPSRTNLLLPLNLGPGTRVLDFGGGTGALSRGIADTGATVVTLEGSYSRCQVAAARMAGMPNASVMCGSVEDYLANRPEQAPEEFDVIVVCGVLEYSGSDSGGAGGPLEMLRNLKALLAPDGIIALAIENQWGLKYLLSYPEDHLGLPWIGLEGYWRDSSGVRTWARTELEGLFRAAGLNAIRMLAAMPDYKMPSVLIDGALFDTADGRTLAKQFVRSPLSAAAGAPPLAADPILTYQSAVDAGLGLETANSFLALIGREEVNPAYVRPGLLWIATSERTRRWRSQRALVREGDAWQLNLISGQSTTEGALHCIRSESDPVVVGANCEDLLRQQLSKEGLASPAVGETLRTWAQEAIALLNARDGAGTSFDIMPNNFIIDADGRWHMVDREFTWAAEVAPEVWLYRALWFTAERLAESGIVKGLAPAATRDSLVRRLAEAAGLQFGPDALEQWVAVESELAGLVLGWNPDQIADFAATTEQLRQTPALEDEQQWSVLDLLEAIAQRDTRIQELTALVDQVHEVLDETRGEWSKTQLELDRHRLLLAEAHQQVGEVHAALNRMRESTSWKVTAPIRKIKRG